MTPDDRKRLEEVMPFYIQARSSAQDRAFLESQLQDPEARAMLEWHRALAEKIRRRVDAVRDDVGHAGLMAAIRAQQKSATVSAPASWKSWLALDRWIAPALQMPAFAALALVVIAQGALLYPRDYADPDGYGSTRGSAASAAAAAKRVILKVNFKDETSEQNLRMLLINAGVHIVDGPSQLGDYVLSAPAQRAQEAREILEKSPWVNAVHVVKSAPNFKP
jgi:hypothetical protein